MNSNNIQQTSDKLTNKKTKLGVKKLNKSNNIQQTSDKLTNKKTKLGVKKLNKRKSVSEKVQSNKKNDPIQCPHCKYSSKEDYSLQLHILLTHLEVDSMIIQKTTNEVKTYVCKECSFEATRDYIMWSHILTHEQALSSIIKCKYSRCKFTCKDSYTMRNHMKTHHYNRRLYTEERGKGMYSCTLCSFKTCRKVKGHYYRHVKDNARILGCKMCGYKTNNTKLLKLHVHDHQNNKVPNSGNYLKCIFCHAETSDVRQFSLHSKKCSAGMPAEHIYRVIVLTSECPEEF